jgi:hypothetical protein
VSSEFVICVDRKMTEINQKICDALKPELGEKKAWIFLRQDRELYISTSPVPKIEHGDEAAILYDRGVYKGAVNLARPKWRIGCEALWAVAEDTDENDKPFG